MLPPPEGLIWTVVFYLNNVYKYFHLHTENNFYFFNNLCLAVLLPSFQGGGALGKNPLNAPVYIDILH